MTMMEATETLDEVLSRYANLGHREPETIAEMAISELGDERLSEALVALAPEILAERARDAIRRAARNAENALKPADPVTSQRIREKTYWVPNHGRKRGYDMTAADWRERAAFYIDLGDANYRRATWCNAVADLMDEQGAKTLKALKVDLPALPDGDSLEEIAS